ncbi:hypothetical protein L7F22_006630 [Adiantum nelumboides]|nr:hypothetical protein [Adiantum nelumboides]
MKEQVTLDGSTSNNEVEYDVLISGLKICLAQKIQRLMVKGDALLIVNQILGIWACKNERLRIKVSNIRKHFSQFEEVQLYHICRKENEDANLLAQQALSNQDKTHVVIAAIALKDPQYAGMESLTHVVNYILEGEFPKKFTTRQRRKLIKQASMFLWLEGVLYQKGKDLICRRVPSTSEIPKILKGFRKCILTEVCEEFKISHRHSTPYYPQSNGLMEKANGIIAGIIRKMVESKPNRWDNFLDGAIWAYRTTYRDATQFTPFHLVYGQEALQPIELNIPAIKLTGRQEQNNDEAWIDRLLTLVELEWKREVAYHCYKRKALQIKDKLNEGLKYKEIKGKSLVLRYNNALDSTFDAKFECIWEGPFIVKKAFTGGYYQLMDLNGKEHPRKVVIANGPFEKWGIDAMGPLPRTANGRFYILVAIDYMTRFGTPLEIDSDNGPGFRRGLLTKVCEELKISHRHSTPYYPQSNGLVEKANGIIAGIIRKMVESKPKRWDNFLDGAIWAYRTTYRDATQFTPFHLVYGQESLQPIELNIPSNSQGDKSKTMMKLGLINSSAWWS